MDESLIAQYPELEERHFWWKVRRKVVRRLALDFGLRRSRVLDVGCGSGMTSSMLAADGAAVVGVDSEPSPRTDGDSSFEFVQGDYLKAAASLGEFDLVLALDSVEHFADEEEVIRALVSNLAQDGKLIVTVPAYQWLWSEHDEINAHYRRYTRRMLTRSLTKEGLSVERAGYLFAGLVPVKGILVVLEKTLGRSVSGRNIGPLSNGVAARYFAAESRIALKRSTFLPFGTSVIAIATKLAK